MSFDGVDYVRLATTISLGNTDWTVTAWMKINNAGSNPLLSNWNGGPVTNCLSVLGSKISYGHYLVSWLYENGTSNIEDNRWHFLTWANHSNKTIDLYVDGVIDKAGAISSVSNSGPVNNIGRNWATTANGSIDEVKVFNRALSADEVLFMYNHEKGKFSVGQDGSMQALEFVEDPTLPVQMRSKKESLTVKGQLIEQ
jgi:hypothetical protein